MRAITKAIGFSTVHALNADIPFSVDENGMPVANMIFNVNGTCSESKALRIATKQAKDANGNPTKNVMIIKVDTCNGPKISLDANVFLAHSEICQDNVTYGHEYITREFNATSITVMYIDNNGMHNDTLIYDGITTANKLLNYARKSTNCQNCVITKTENIVERRYMSNAKFEELALKYGKKTDKNDSEN